MYGCFELAGLFASPLQKESMPVLSTIEAQLSLHKRKIVKATPEARECQETASYEQAKVRNCTRFAVLCVL